MSPIACRRKRPLTRGRVFDGRALSSGVDSSLSTRAAGAWCNWRRRTTAAKWLIFQELALSYFLRAGGRQLGTQEDLQALLGSVDYQLGVLAGNHGIDPFHLDSFRGRVMEKSRYTVRESWGCAHAVLPVSHTFSPVMRRCIARRSIFFNGVISEGSREVANESRNPAFTVGGFTAFCDTVLGAFNDNAFKNALLIWIAYESTPR